MVEYMSTRSAKGSAQVGAEEAILKGIAEDGGLYVPSTIPKLSVPLRELASLDYRALAFTVMKDWLPGFSAEELKACIALAYDGKFDTPEIAPLRVSGDVSFLELFHGPTLAFKDMALALLPHLLLVAAKKMKNDKEIVILTATSGDTGKAALEGFADVPGTRIIVFFPQEGVSEIQRRQMVTQKGANVSVIGIEGNFDDAQNGVKKMFTDPGLVARLASNGMMFSSANSINIGRLLPQVVYYFHAYLGLCRSGKIGYGDGVNFVVPSGNFGNILAGYYAKLMGLPVARLVSASNENKVLYDFFKTGKYDRIRPFHVTTSPSMDILVSSNLERLLYSASGNDGGQTGEWMKNLSGIGSYDIGKAARAALSGFSGEYADEKETSRALKSVFDSLGYVMDTHTAVAYSAWEKDRASNPRDASETVVVSTASPFKFARSVLEAMGKPVAGRSDFELVAELSRVSGVPVPPGIRGLETLRELHRDVCGKDEMQARVEKILGLKR